METGTAPIGSGGFGLPRRRDRKKGLFWFLIDVIAHCTLVEGSGQITTLFLFLFLFFFVGHRLVIGAALKKAKSAHSVLIA